MPIDTDNPPESFRDHLYSVDTKGRRHWLYVDWNWGWWRRWRVVISWALIAVYLTVPWMRIDNNPVFRVNFQDKHLTLLGMDFLPSDIPIFFALTMMAVLLTLLSVALLGRVFCGWLCPHNVFLETVFRPLEQLLEGPAHRRKRQDKHPTFGLRLRKTVKWLGYIAFCGAMANAGVALFLGTDIFLFGLLIDPTVTPGGTVFFVILFGLCLFNFSWFREQTCTLVCPYGRLQAGMLDDESLIVAYDKNRGEPRGKPNADNGDCVDCKRCIHVCPTGIDIRNGTQLECIHCTACIDACDTIMDKLNKPRGLIRYSSEKELAGGKRRWLRPRVFLYLAVLTLVTTFAVIFVTNRATLQARIMYTAIPPTAFTDDNGTASWRVAVPVHIRNPIGKELAVTMHLEPRGGILRTASSSWLLQAGETRDQTMFVEYPISETGPISLIISTTDQDPVRLPIAWNPSTAPSAAPSTPTNDERTPGQ